MNLIEYALGGNMSLMMFVNLADPRSTVTLSDESIEIPGLEEFISYRFTVSIATSVGETPNDEMIGCTQTDPAGLYTHMHTHAHTYTYSPHTFNMLITCTHTHTQLRLVPQMSN